MPFRLRTEAQKWFKPIEKRLGGAPMFDMYYFCLLAGLADGRLGEAKDSETAELVDSFPGDYAPRGRLIIALFLSRELQRQAIRLTERASVNAAIGRLVDPNTPSRLSAEGMRLMNHFAYGGFDVISEWFDDQPRQLETFLPMFHERISRRLGTAHTPS